MKKSILFVSLLILLLIALTFSNILSSASITVAQDNPTPTPEPGEDDHPQDDGDDHDDGDEHDEDAPVAPIIIETGYELFVSNGCIACHGTNAEGTELAPALYGHAREDIYRQLRTPVGIMTPFSPEQISIRDAEYLVAYIENLPMPTEMDMSGEHMHMMGGFRINHVVEYHHWYALEAVKEDNIGQAIHHIGHVIEFTEGQHQVAMQTILEQIVDGELEEAQASLEDMLFGLTPPETPEAENYIRFALVMVTMNKPFHAVDDLEHSGEILPLDSPLQDKIKEIIALIEFGDMEAAEQQLTDLIATFAPIDSDMDHMDDEHDDGMDMGDDTDHMDDDDMGDMDMGDDSMDGMNMDDDDMDGMNMGGLESVDDLVTALENAGATVSLEETLEQPFFSVTAQVVLVNETEALQVFEYEDEASAMAEADLVDPSGSPIGTSQVSWMMPPHFYQSGNLIVIYLGIDPHTVSLLTDVLGEQFAGSTAGQ